LFRLLFLNQILSKKNLFQQFHGCKQFLKFKEEQADDQCWDDGSDMIGIRPEIFQVLSRVHNLEQDAVKKVNQGWPDFFLVKIRDILNFPI